MAAQWLGRAVRGMLGVSSLAQITVDTASGTLTLPVTALYGAGGHGMASDLGHGQGVGGGHSHTGGGPPSSAASLSTSGPPTGQSLMRKLTLQQLWLVRLNTPMAVATAGAGSGGKPWERGGRGGGSGEDEVGFFAWAWALRPSPALFPCPACWSASLRRSLRSARAPPCTQLHVCTQSPMRGGRHGMPRHRVHSGGGSKGGPSGAGGGQESAEGGHGTGGRAGAMRVPGIDYTDPQLGPLLAHASLVSQINLVVWGMRSGVGWGGAEVGCGQRGNARVVPVACACGRRHQHGCMCACCCCCILLPVLCSEHRLCLLLPICTCCRS